MAIRNLATMTHEQLVALASWIDRHGEFADASMEFLLTWLLVNSANEPDAFPFSDNYLYLYRHDYVFSLPNKTVPRLAIMNTSEKKTVEGIRRWLAKLQRAGLLFNMEDPVVSDPDAYMAMTGMTRRPAGPIQVHFKKAVSFPVALQLELDRRRAWALLPIGVDMFSLYPKGTR